MAYDRELVERIHALLAGEPTLEQKNMFGGVGFMVEGSLVVGAMSDGNLLARVGSEAAAELIGDGAEQMEMKGRPMTGWLRVSAEAVDDDDPLKRWVQRCLAFVRQNAAASP